MVGARLGDWIIEAEVRKNAMGRLYRAHAAEEPGRQTAVRVLTHPKAQTAEFEKLFLSQVELLRKLKHPNIVAVLGGGIHDGKPYSVMEWVEGVDCETLLRQGERPTWSEVLATALQIVPALRYAHRRSVLHRDLKPSNLFRCPGGCAKLSDFGITKFFGDALLTNADNILGSGAFISPEQAAGKPATKRSDFYALGCLLYTLIVGRPPFTGSTVVELIHKHCFILPERPIHFVRDLPEEFDRFVMKLIAKEPAQRPGSGTMLIQEIEGIWSALERRGLLGKRPAFVEPADDAAETNAGDKEGESGANGDSPLEPRWPEPIPRLPTPWQKRWYVVLPLFVACLFTLLWAFFWRGPDADELMSNARPLLESNKPADWEKAWNDYLEPLSRKFPGQHADEVAQARVQIESQRELQRAFVTGRLAKYPSEAERFYYEGLRLVQAGEFTSARRVWENLVRAYGAIAAEKRWVSLAEEGIGRLEQQPSGQTGHSVHRPSKNPNFNDLVRPAVDEVQRLRAAGQFKAANEMSAALEFLYRDDPALETLRRMLENK